MPDLIHRLALVARKLPLRIQRVLLEKEPDLIPRRQEVLVSNMVVVVRRELCLRSQDIDIGVSSNKGVKTLKSTFG